MWDSARLIKWFKGSYLQRGRGGRGLHVAFDLSLHLLLLPGPLAPPLQCFLLASAFFPPPPLQTAVALVGVGAAREPPSSSRRREGTGARAWPGCGAAAGREFGGRSAPAPPPLHRSLAAAALLHSSLVSLTLHPGFFPRQWVPQHTPFLRQSEINSPHRHVK